MKARLKAVIATTACVALTGAGLLASMGAASAAGSTGPLWEPDPNALGSIVLYDSTGKILTGGTNLSHLVDFAAVTTGPSVGATGPSNKATLSFAMPDHTKVTGLWSVGSAGASSLYPTATAPAPLTAPFANPTVSLGSADANLTSFMGTYGQDSTAGYADVFQLRVKDGGNGASSGTHYWATDIQLVRSTDGTITGWQVLYPSVASSSTVVTQTSGSSSPQATAANGSTTPITLTSTTSPAGAGSVQFFDNGVLAATQPANASGVAAYSPTPAPVASGVSPVAHSYTSQYTAPGGVATTGSTSAPFVYTVTQTPTTTTTILARTGGSTAFSAQTFTATVTPSNATGTVAFFDNGSTTPMAGAVTPNAGSYVLNTSALDIGDHSVVASFTAQGAFTSSTSSPAVTFTLAKPACPGDPHAYPTTGANAGQTCSANQPIQVAVTPGYLTISTPYSSTSPFVLPAMTLNAAGTLLSTSANFPNVANVAGSTGSDAPLIITSTLSGDPSWTASVTATDLVGKIGTAPSGTFDKIDGQNIGLTNWLPAAASSNALNGLKFYDLAAATGVVPGTTIVTGAMGLKGQPKTFATTPGGGNGTVQAYGLMTITAPTNTIADTYTGTITFNVA